MFIHLDERPGYTVAVTDRGVEAGASAGPYAGRNLARHVGDEAAAVEANRADVATALGLPADAVVYMNQTHSTTIRRAIPDDPAYPLDADALVTTEPGLALAVLVADCVPVLLVDPAAGVAAAVHAGRAGFIGGIVPATLTAMADLGATAPVATVGPSICGRCYEVPAALRDAAVAVSPASAAVSWTGTPAIDVAAGVVEQLRTEGVPVTWVPGCTREHADLFSYRRETPTGRFGGFVVLRRT